MVFTRKTYRPVRKTFKKTTYRKKVSPNRFKTNYRTYKKTYRLSKKMTNYGETIYTAITNQNEISPTNQVGTTKCFTLAYTLGATVPTGWTNYLALGGMSVPNGSDTNERHGQFTYLKKTHLNCSIDMKPNTSSGNGEPIEFRVICFKAKVGARNFGSSYSPNSTLFYNTAGQEIGEDSTGIVGADLQLQPLNRKRWSIYCDKKFILSPMGESTSGSSNYKYPSRKTMSLSLPFYKKVRYNTSNEPQDIDIHYGLLIIANGIAKFQDADRWEFNCRGTTTCSDS